MDEAKNKQKKPVSDKLALCLAQGMSITKSAEACGICRDTVYERLRDSAFRETIETIRNDIMSASVGGLVALGTKVIARLDELLDDPDKRIRVAAIGKWIEAIDRLSVNYDLARRIEDLKQDQGNNAQRAREFLYGDWPAVEPKIVQATVEVTPEPLKVEAKPVVAPLVEAKPVEAVESFRDVTPLSRRPPRQSPKRDWGLFISK